MNYYTICEQLDNKVFNIDIGLSKFNRYKSKIESKFSKPIISKKKIYINKGYITDVNDNCIERIYNIESKLIDIISLNNTKFIKEDRKINLFKFNAVNIFKDIDEEYYLYSYIYNINDNTINLNIKEYEDKKIYTINIHTSDVKLLDILDI